MKSNLYTSELVMVINANGGIHCSEKYIDTIEEKALTDEVMA